MKITVTQSISAPAEAVFAALCDISGRPEVIPSVSACEVHTEGPFGVGTRFTETRVLFGKEASETMEVIELEPGRSYLLEAHNHGAHYLTRYQVDPAAEGEGSTLTFAFEGRPETLGAKVMSALMGWMFKGATEKACRQDLEAIKAGVEGLGPPSGSRASR